MLYTYQPKANAPDLPITDSEVLPWFNQPGGGRQIEFDVPEAMRLYEGHPHYDDMFDGDRLKLDYWFDISGSG